MFGVSNTPRPIGSVGLPTPEAVRIGNHSLETLQQKVGDQVEPHLQRAFFRWMTVAKSDPNTAFSSLNAFMFAALDTVSTVMSDYRIHLTPDSMPENVDLLVKTALSRAKQSALLAKVAPPHSASAKFIEQVDPEKVDFGLAAIRELHLHGIGEGTPFADIAPEHRWRMCIDPQRVAFVEQHLSQTLNHPMIPFLFDSEPAYLHGMLNGWSISMQHLDHPVDSHLVDLLYRACNPTAPDAKSGFFEPGGGFPVKMGANLSPDGRRELLAFAQRVRKVAPHYGVVKDTQVFRNTWPQLATSPDPEALWKTMEPETNGTVVRSPIPQRTLTLLVDEFIQAYHTHMRDAPEQSVRHMVELCQSLERLHPYADRNCRTFGLLLLNNLLVRHGLPMTMLDDPNVLDGFSLDECVAKVEEGQARVQQWCRPKPMASDHAGGLLQARLNARFGSR
ncbi:MULTISPECIES: hypothetical protein [Pseudomonas]|uniref:Fido domain-containing protein n=1 Tax=Pseudomonas quercus TaxID=2722792 RepID=A0ABX0YNV2_9PSED|nr:MULTISPECIES: hypothetical protein [Pseudomonas]MBF7145038.1 hypothetical protein [Pseudomonas sp. LY10J]NJP03648.1 hypothetical protein [Pseudomonas quercus]